MKEGKMTRAEMTKKMQEICDFVNGGYNGECFKLSFDIYGKNSAAFRTDIPGCECQQTIGRAREYAPDPDTREQALEKAHKLQREKEADPDVLWCDCERNPGKSSGYVVTWRCGKDDVDTTEVFKFAETDEQ